MGAEGTTTFQVESPRTIQQKFDRSLYGSVVEEAPLSPAQKSMWFLQLLSPENIAYNVYRAVQVRQDIDIKVFEEAWIALISRHASLRTTFISKNGEPVQRIHASFDFQLVQQNVDGLDEQTINEIICRDALTPFDLQNGPLFRVSLYEQTDALPIILFNFHHIITDLWSFSVLMNEIGLYYDALLDDNFPNLPPLRTSYIEYVTEQNIVLAGDEGKKLERFWKNSLSGDLPVLHLRTDKKRPLRQTFVGKAESIRLSVEQTGALHEMARTYHTSVPTILMAAYNILLYRYTGQDDIIIGTPKAGRSRRTLGTVGYFVNTIPIRSKLAAHQRFVDLLRQVDSTFSAANQHDAYPFSLMVEKLSPKRDAGRSPIYQSIFSYQKSSKKVDADGMAYIAVDKSGGHLNWGSIAVTTKELPLRVAPFDLALLAAESNDGVILSLQYNTDLFYQCTIDRMLHHYQVLLDSILRNPSEFVRHVRLIDDLERNQILYEWNRTFTENPRRHSIKDHFEYVVQHHPKRIALVDGDFTLTYDEFNAKANQVAHYLRSHGIDLEIPVGLMMDRTASMLVVLWGIIKAGGAYIPIDPTYPKERIRYMLKDANARLVISQAAYSDVVAETGITSLIYDNEIQHIKGQATDNPNVTVYPDSLAYIIYTSGSTGKPKGVLLQNRGIGNLVEVQRRIVDVQPTDRVLYYASPSFDASVWEIMMAHLNGAALVLVPNEVRIEPRGFVEFMQRERVSVALLPPSFLAMLPQYDLPHLRSLITGGEACRKESIQSWSEGRRFYNAYGPTEITVCATIKDVTGSSDDNPPIGRPLDNFRLYVLDAELQPVPVGVPGELFISGISLARGYQNKPELTAIRFLPDPYSPEAGTRMYKTGDSARFLDNGDIEFLGRIDFQVKIRGYRIELGEIESALLEAPNIRDVIVQARQDNSVSPALCAYYITEHGRPLERDDMVAFLKDRLPHYMVPANFMHLAAFPVTQNGKIDSKSFPVPKSEMNPGRTVVKPKNDVERKIAQAWQAVLENRSIGVHDNFFEIGGHSLLMIKLHALLQERHGITISVVELFQYPTIASQARLFSSFNEDTTAEKLKVRVDRQRASLAAQRQQMRNRRTHSARNSNR